LYAVKLKLVPRPQRDIKQSMLEKATERYAKHPKGPSVGSVFKLRGYDLGEGRIDYRADDEIKRAKVGNYMVGGVYVSHKYPVFFINDGTGTLDDFISVMRYVYNKVRDATSMELMGSSAIKLQPEVKILPYDKMPVLDNDSAQG
jgi:UDP-N-acetylenolpyruvoylglucosamine reductase